MHRPQYLSRIVDEVNRRNRESTCDPLMRAGWNALLADILMDAGWYAGFGYLMVKDIPAGQKPGIQTDASGKVLGYDARFVDTDDSRRFYY